MIIVNWGILIMVILKKKDKAGLFEPYPLWGIV